MRGVIIGAEGFHVAEWKRFNVEGETEFVYIKR